jgi:hypothetical protein
MLGHKKSQTHTALCKIPDKKVSMDMQVLKKKLNSILPIPKVITGT